MPTTRKAEKNIASSFPAFPSPSLPSWLPSAIAETTSGLYREISSGKRPEDQKRIVDRLVYDERMKRVWAELFKKKRDNYKKTQEYWHRGYVWSASQAQWHRQRAIELRKNGKAEDMYDAEMHERHALNFEKDKDEDEPSKWSEQELAALAFFFSAFRAGIDIKPKLLSDQIASSKKLKNAIAALSQHIAVFQDLKMQSEYVALAELIEDCEYELACRPLRGPRSSESKSNYYRRIKELDPWLIIRGHRDPLLKTVSADLLHATSLIFKTPLWGTIAIVAAVLLERSDVKSDTIRAMFG